MGRIYISNLKTFSSTAKHTKTVFKVYSDLNKTNLIYSGEETDSSKLLELRYDAVVDGVHHVVDENTIAEVNVIYANGAETGFRDVLINDNCTEGN